jgi:hypothetical protein
MQARSLSHLSYRPCLQTRGTARVQYITMDVIMANDARGQCIYRRVRHHKGWWEQDSDHLSRQCQSFKYLRHHISRPSLNAPLRNSLSESLSLPIKTTFNLHPLFLILRLSSDSTTHQTTTITPSARLRRRHFVAVRQKATCAGSP